jgi:hypothetical protein
VRKYGSAVGIRSSHNVRQRDAVRAVEPSCRVGDDREKGDDPGADQERDHRVIAPAASRRRQHVNPDNEERRDRDEWRDLKDHDIREEADLDESRQREQDGDQPADQHRRGERRQRDSQGEEQRTHQASTVVPQALRDVDRAGQHIGLEREIPDDRCPQSDKQSADDDWRGDAQP